MFKKKRLKADFTCLLKKGNYIIYLIMIAFLAIQCGNDKESKAKDALNSDKNKRDFEILMPVVNYHLLSVKDNLEWIKSLKQGDTLNALLVLNRVDKVNLTLLDSIIMPDSIAPNLAMYSPFPIRIDVLLPIRKIVLVSYNSEAFCIYENGNRVRWGATSLGKSKMPTPTGLYFTNWKAEETISTFDDEWVLKWNFNIDNAEGVSMHEYSLPGYPASHSCIRLSHDDAYWIYNWADEWILSTNTKIAAYGTPVLVYGKYPFGKSTPRFSLAMDAKALQITPKEITSILASFVPLILQRQVQRDSLLATRVIQ